MEKSSVSRRAFNVSAMMGGALVLSQVGSAQSSEKILDKKQLANLVANAKTADDHRKLAAHYRAVAAKHEVEAKEHMELAAKYRAHPTGGESKHPGGPDTAAHCLTLAEHCRNMAKTMGQMATMHDEMAKKAK